MNDNLGLVLIFGVGGVALCSFLSVAAWVDARRREREALYKSQAIQKIAEMQGNAPESVLALLREALTQKESFPWFGTAPQEYRKERESFYRSEAIKAIAATGTNGADAALQYLREEDRKGRGRRNDEFKLGGLIMMAVGIALMVFLQQFVPGRPVYLAGLLPLLIGAVLLARGTLFSSKD